MGNCFGDYIGDEEIDREFKVFTFNLAGLNITIEDAIKLCHSNQFIFNKQIISNLEAYFDIYASKYLAGFFNIGISGTLIFGINDWGFVMGIPFQGDLPIDSLTDSFYQSLKRNVRNSSFTGKFEDIVKINISKVEYRNDRTESIHPQFKKYLDDLQTYNEIMKSDKEIFENWKIRYAFFNRKLIDLLNGIETRILIIDYISKIDPDNPVIQLLRSDEKIVS